MEYAGIRETDFPAFHELLNEYYREGEDENTAQEEIDAFIQLLFDQLTRRAIEGCFAKEGTELAGFALWAVDTEDFAFSEMPGYATILEISLRKPWRGAGRGKELASHAEAQLMQKAVEACYVSAYGPAKSFWEGCGYQACGKEAGNGLPILVKLLRAGA